MEATESIRDRIRKLLRHSESAAKIGSQAEAEVFAEKASRLMLEHKLDQVGLSAEEAAEVFGTEWFGFNGTAKTKIGWRSVLVNGLANTHFCRVVIDHAANRRHGAVGVIIAGKPSDQEVVRYLFAVLSRACDTAADAYRPVVNGWQQTTRKEKNTFRLGFVAGVLAKIRETRRAVEHTGGGYAVTLYQRADLAVAAYYRQQFPRATSGAPVRALGSGDAYRAGKDAGRAQNVNSGIGGSAGARRMLGAG